MERRKKLTGLDAEVYEMWNDLTFPNGMYWGVPVPMDEYREKQRKRRPGWEAIFAKAYQGGEWKVGSGIASMVTRGRWLDLMAFGEYDSAIELIKKCLAHPKPFDPSELIELPILLQLSKLCQYPDGQAARTLKSMIDSGIDQPSVVASQIERGLVGLGEHMNPNTPIPKEVGSLILAVAAARKYKKRHVDACRHVETWGDLFQLLEAAAR